MSGEKGSNFFTNRASVIHVDVVRTSNLGSLKMRIILP